MSFPGWEDPEVVVTSKPEKWLLPKPDVATWNDPRPLRGFGAHLPSVSETFGASSAVVRQIGPNVEATLIRPEVFGVVLLDSFEVDTDGAPCSLLLEVFEDDRETVRWSVATSPLHPTPFLTEPGQYATQEIDVAQGGATLGTVSVTVIDPARIPGDQDSGWMTEKLSALGLGDIQGRRCVLRRFISEALGYTVIADGPAGTPAMDASYAAFTWQIRDTREGERKLPLFTEGAEQALLPEGIIDGYGFDPVSSTWLIDPLPPLKGRYNAAGFSVDVASYNAAPARTMTYPAYVAVQRRVPNFSETNPADYVNRSPLWIQWRAQGSSDPWTEIRAELVVALLPTVPITIFDFNIRPEGGPVEIAAFVLSTEPDTPSLMPADGEDIEFYLMGIRGVPPTKEVPFTIDGITAGEFVRNAYDGLYSPRNTDGSIVPTGLRYDEAAVLQMTEPVRIRLSEPIDDARDWIEKNIYAPLGWTPALDRLGHIAPVSQVAPEEVIGLPSITNAITEPSPDWNAGERIINDLQFQYFRDYRPTDPADAETGDGLAAREVDVEYKDTDSIIRHREQVLSLASEAFRAVGTPEGEAPSGGGTDDAGFHLARDRQRHLLARYGFGSQAIRLTVRRSALPLLETGDWVVLDLSWLPDYLTQKRGLIGLAQVVSLGDLDCAWRQLLVEQVTPIEES